MLTDLRFALRQLRKSPGFTFTAVLTLALGIGANTAIFSVVNGVLLRPLPYKNPEQLVSVYEKRAKLGHERGFVSPPDFVDWHGQNTVFENLAAYTPWTANRTDMGEPERIVGSLASADLFPALGVSPVLGRIFLAQDDQPNASLVVVISHDSCLTMLLLASFATLAIILAAIGIYGVISYGVAQRTHEIGVRMALGAQRSDVLQLILGQAMTLAALGIGFGLAASLGPTRVLSSLLFGVSATDSATLISVSLLLGIVGLAACYLPARCATLVNPVEALRAE
jgi:hypothetical protein